MKKEKIIILLSTIAILMSYFIGVFLSGSFFINEWNYLSQLSFTISIIIYYISK